jgi:hypothetical protein
MGMLYAWATPDYLLWHMTIGQVIMLHNKAIEIRTPKKDGQAEHDADELVARRDEIRRTFPELREMWEHKYGDVTNGESG